MHSLELLRAEIEREERRLEKRREVLAQLEAESDGEDHSRKTVCDIPNLICSCAMLLTLYTRHIRY
jgi:hypothetical protein